MSLLFFLKPLWDNADILGEDAYKKVRAFEDGKREAQTKAIAKKKKLDKAIRAGLRGDLTDDEEWSLIMSIIEDIH